jgi:hypothetical protein
VEYLPKEELSSLDPELYPREKMHKRQELIKRYVDVRKLAQVASGLGDKGLSSF